ncbi:C40 family peptidase [Paenibacillus sp. PR3]|uniref:C40 family peptidase n=1 Tax=Paenibacillus terricola TaxID=2763503 RepID=A0ABR8MSL2_9BACL|nr:C40 family peptidase [Paenibacillus terricola]MBD3918962.1 C40 family peptidase [Paenibacillus terricola]
MNIKKPWMKTIVSVMLGATIGLASLGLGFTGQASAATPKAEEVLTTGKSYLGIPYRFGAPSNVTSAFDCSSFTQYIFKENGIELPRTSKEQSTLGTKVAKSYLSMGDLVFFSSDSSSTVAHVAIYAGNNKILHAATSSGVTISNIDSTYWSKNYITARRVIK